MPRKRPKGVFAMGWACIEAAAKGRTEHTPLSEDYPDSVVRRTSSRSPSGLFENSSLTISATGLASVLVMAGFSQGIGDLSITSLP